MKHESMTSMQRVLTALSHREADRVPYFLLLTMHGAKELGLSIRDYFSKAEHVAEGQLRLRAQYGHDCLYGFFYAGIEVEAWGGGVIYVEDGPPNTDRPFIQDPEVITGLKVPDINTLPCLTKVLTAIKLMKRQVGDECPIIGVAISPFSLPIMQMGFGPYLDLIQERPKLFDRLMQLNEDFCVNWANAQLEAGATAICYFDPVSSSTIIPRDEYLRTGWRIAKRTIGRIKGPTATHFASGRTLPILADIGETGTAVVGVSCQENLSEIKAACTGKLTVLGNLNGIEMRRWSIKETEDAVRHALTAAAEGGGFILADNHGEIPWQVPEAVLLAIRDAVECWGNYPLTWTADWKD